MLWILWHFSQNKNILSLFEPQEAFEDNPSKAFSQYSLLSHMVSQFIIRFLGSVASTNTATRIGTLWWPNPRKAMSREPSTGRHMAIKSKNLVMCAVHQRHSENILLLMDSLLHFKLTLLRSHVLALNERLNLYHLDLSHNECLLFKV